MMARYHAKCEVCHSVTLVRIQAGHLPEYPVRIYCGNCGIMFSGKVEFDEDNAWVDLKLNNCIQVGRDEDPKYSIEISGELPTAKLHEIVDAFDPRDFMSPFIRMGRISESYQGVITFMRRIKDYWPIHRRIHELYISGKEEFLVKEIRKLGMVVPNKLQNKLDYIVSVHHTLVMFLSPPLTITGFYEDSRRIGSSIMKLYNEPINEHNENFKAFVEYVNQKDYTKMETKIFKCIEAFVEKFQYMVPSYSLYFYSENSMPSHEDLGVTTAVLEDLKSFYVDTYETIMDHIEILMGLNNLIHRKSYTDMKIIRSDVSTIEQFENLQNGKKIDYVNGEEEFDSFIFQRFDNTIRNAMSHASTSYDGANQIITYYPKNKEDNEKRKEIYLIEFLQKCIEQFSALMNIWEMIYTIKKISRLYEGEQLSVEMNTDKNVIAKKGSKKKFTSKNKRKQQKNSRKINR